MCRMARALVVSLLCCHDPAVRQWSRCLLAVCLRRSVRGDGGQVGAMLETETRSELEYKGKISSFQKNVICPYCSGLLVVLFASTRKQII